MIVDLKQFVASERIIWEELDRVLAIIENDPGLRLTLEEARRLHYLYERTGASLVKVSTFAAEPTLIRSLEKLLARAYAELHEPRLGRKRFSIARWLFWTFPQTFRKHIRYFFAALVLTIAGGIFGAAAIGFDPEAKTAIMPFPQLLGDPAARVKQEEAQVNPALEQERARFSALLMTNNISVSIMALALGLTWGIGTAVLLLYNGVILGAIVVDYLRAGQSAFLLGWLLPHGVIEIPAILIAGQAGLLLGQALIGWQSNNTLGERLRTISGSLVTLISGTGLLLIWAGFIEAFYSQYHAPVLPYAFKISFGLAEFLALLSYLFLAGSRTGEKL